MIPGSPSFVFTLDSMGSRPLYAKAVDELPLSTVGIEAGTNESVQGPVLAVRCCRWDLLVLEFTFGRLLILWYLFVYDLTEARPKSEFKCSQFTLGLCRVKFLNLGYYSCSFIPGLVCPWSLKPHDPLLWILLTF